MKKRIGIIGLLFILGVYVAAAEPRLPEEAPKTLYPLKQCVAVQDIAPYIDKVEVVTLEATPKSLIGEMNKMVLRPDGAFVLLTHTGIYVFDKTGKFLFPVGRIGEGPGEYVRASDLCLSADGRSILVLTAYRQVLRYQADDGKFVKTIALDPALQHSCDGIAPAPNDGFYLYAGNPADANDFETPFNCLLQYDAEGKLVARSLPRKDFGMQVATITQAAGNRYILRPQEGDNLAYRTDARGEFHPWLRIDFGERAVPSGYIKKLGGSVWKHLQTFLRSDYYKMPIYIEQTRQAVYFMASGPEARSYEFLYFTGAGRGIQWKSEALSVTPFLIGASDDGWFYGVYDDAKSYSAAELATFSPLKRYLVEQVGVKVSDDGNPPLVKIRFKPDK